MSQHVFKTRHEGFPVTVIMGWDRPLHYFFLVIERDDAGDDEEAFLYSNLNEPTPFGMSLDYYQGVLARLGIGVPRQMLVEVARDGRENVGNRRVDYRPDGAVLENEENHPA